MRRTVLAIVAALGAAGCSKPAGDLVTPEGTGTRRRLTAAFTLYTAYLDKKGRSPLTADELSAFGEKLPTTEGGPVSLTPEFMVSPRDKQAIVVRYGLPLKPTPKPPAGQDPPPPTEGPVLAYEAAGVNGKRFVVFAGTGRVDELDEAAFRAAVPDAR